MQKWCPESQITAYAHVAWRWKALSDVLSISPFCCCVSPSPKSTSWRLSKEWLVFQLCVSYGTQTVLATASILLCLFLLIPLKVYHSDSAHKDNCFIARTQYSALVRLSIRLAGPAWYQLTHACANFTREYWRKRIWWRTNWAESIDYTSSVLYHYQLFIFAKFQRTGKVSLERSVQQLSLKRTKASSAKAVSPETSRCRPLSKLPRKD